MLDKSLACLQATPSFSMLHVCNIENLGVAWGQARDSGGDLSHTGWGFITQVGIYHTGGDLSHRWGFIINSHQCMGHVGDLLNVQ